MRKSRTNVDQLVGAHTTPAQSAAVQEPAGVTDERSASTTEIEIKLFCDPEEMARVIASPTVARYARGEGQSFPLTAIYYDTPELELQKSGTVLRVRTDGARFVMTMKSRSKSNGKALERMEWKVPVESMEPDRAALPQFLSPEIIGRIEQAPLDPLFSMEVQRYTRLLESPLGVVELAADQGRIVARERSEAVHEIELELMEGRTEAIFQIAHELLADFHLRPSIRSKSARGADLAAGKAPSVTKARDLTFPSDATLDQALDAILRAALQHLLENQPAAEDGSNPKGIHQYRVALRRLRSVLGLIRPLAPSLRLDEFRDDAQWLMRNLNDVRDWDVFVTETLPAIAQACPAVDGFDALKDAARKRRAEALDRARTAILDPRTGKFQVALGLWVEQHGWLNDVKPQTRDVFSEPGRVYAAWLLDRLHRKVLKRGRHFRKLSPEERHRLRITLKKLRYVGDFFMPLLAKPKEARRLAKILATLQARLGHHNDIAVTEGLIDSITRTRIPVSAQRAAGAVLGWQARHLSGEDDDDLLAAWDVFQDSRFPA